MWAKKYIIFILLIILCNNTIAETNTASSNIKTKEKISEDTLKFWEKTLKYGTSAQKRSVLYTIKGERVTKAASIIIKYLPQEKNLTVKKEMISALVVLSNQSAAPYLIELLKKTNNSEEVIEFALSSIAMIKYKKAGKYILKYLDFPNIQIRETALRALGEIEYKEAVPIIIKKFEEEEQERVRTEMILALAKIKSEKAQKFLISIFTNSDEKLLNREFAATGLGYIKNKLSYDILTRYIEKVDSKIKVRIVEALGNLEDKSAINILIECLKDDDKSIRYYAARALGRLKAKEAIDILEYKKDYDLEPKVRKAAEDALKQIRGDEGEGN